MINTKLQKEILKEHNKCSVKLDVAREKSGQSIKGEYDYKISNIPNSVNIKTIDKVYIGKPNRCMCGCSGKYYDTKGSYDKEDINEQKVKKVLNRMKKHNDENGYKVIEDYIILKVIGNTQYTIYLKD